MLASFSPACLCWIAGAVVVSTLHRTGTSRSRIDRSRWAGLFAGAVCAHLGWVVVHTEAIVAAAGWAGWIAWSLDPMAGASVLFAPLGPVCVRRLGRAPAAALDADLRAWVAGLAMARLGCIWAGCCGGGDPGPLASAVWSGAAWDSGAPALRHPVALYDAIGLACAAGALRRPGGGGWAIAIFGLLRAGLDPLRPAPPHGGSTDWVPWVCAGWVVFGVLFGLAFVSRLRGAGPIAAQ